MARQYVRLADVRPPSAQNDTQTTPELTANSYSADSADDFLQTVLSQIRILTGQSKWQDPPQADIAQIATVQTSTVQTIQQIVPMVQTTMATTVDQTGLIAELQQDVLNADANVAALSDTVAKLQTLLGNSGGGAFATQQSVTDLQAVLQAQLTTARNQIAALATQTQSVADQEAALQAQLAALAAQVSSLKPLLVGQPLSGLQNSKNLTFYTVVPFVPESLSVYYNGVRLRLGPTSDFIVAPGNATVGYEQITLVYPAMAPRAVDLLTADYRPA